MSIRKERFEKKSFLELVEEFETVSLDEVYSYSNPIILDTNFLFVPFEFDVDIISEIERLIGTNYHFFIFEGTIHELSEIEKKGDKNKKYLPLILTMIKHYSIQIISSSSTYVDKDILNCSGVLIATNDAQLRKQLWSIPNRVLFMRQKHYLDIK